MMSNAVRRTLGLILAAFFGLSPAFADDNRPVLFMSSAGGHRSASMGAQDYLRRAYPNQAIAELDLVQQYAAFPQAQGEEHWRYLIRILPDAVTPEELNSLEARIREINPKSIISTDYPNARALAKLKEQGRISVPIAWIHVDLVDNDMYRSTALGMDQTFVGSEDIRQNWIRDGIEADRIATTGFPVRALFADSAIRAQPIQAQEIPVITMIGGSWGLLEFAQTVLSIDSQMRTPVKVVAVTGRNASERQSLLALKESGQLRHVQIEVLELVPQDQLLTRMQQSQLVISKPGGATVFEMAYANTSVLYVNHMSAPHEEKNMQFALSRGAASSVANYDSIGLSIVYMLANPFTQQSQRQAQERWRSELNPHAIANWVTGWASTQCRRQFKD